MHTIYLLEGRYYLHARRMLQKYQKVTYTKPESSNELHDSDNSQGDSRFMWQYEYLLQNRQLSFAKLISSANSPIIASKESIFMQ